MTITLTAVREAAQKVIVPRSDYFYQMPETTSDYQYSDPGTGTPSCGVGWILQEVDPEGYETIKQWEAEVGTSFVFARLGRYSNAAKRNIPALDITPDARAFLIVFQRNQDRRVRWGTCLKAAEATYPVEAKLWQVD